MGMMEDFISKVRTAVYGRDVRAGIADALATMWDLTQTATKGYSSAISTANSAATKANTAAEKVGTVAGNPVTSKTQITNNGAEVKIPWKKIVPSGVTPTVDNFLSIISPAHPSGLVVAEIISGDNYVLTLTPRSDVSQPYSVEVTVFYRSK